MNSHVSDTDERVLVHIHVSDITKLKLGTCEFHSRAFLHMQLNFIQTNAGQYWNFIYRLLWTP